MEGLFYLACFLGLYFLPTVFAFANSHLNAAAIFVLNLFLGWTLLGWVIALVWAFTSHRAQPTHARQ
jgi:hypothetical protein